MIINGPVNLLNKNIHLNKKCIHIEQLFLKKLIF